MSPQSFALGPLEMEVVGLFAPDQELSVGDIQTRLKLGGNTLAYTTVMTVLTRLHAKGMIARRKQGRQYLYSPAKQSQRLGHAVLEKLKRSFFRTERLRPILALLEGEDALTSAELLELRKAVDSKIREKRKS